VIKTRKLRIGDFCQTGTGGTPSRGNPEFYGGKIPWVKSGELKESIITHTEETLTELAIAKTNVKIVPIGAILLAMYGATVGRLAILGINATTNQAVCNIIPDEKIAHPKFIFYALQNKVPDFLNKAVGGAQPNISQGIIRDTEIFLPSLDDQVRIAGILDKADAIRRKRRQALQLADDFLRSVFLDLFGDPITNPKSWPTEPLANIGLLSRGKSKHRPRNDPKLLNGPYPLIQTGDVTQALNYIRHFTQTYSEFGLKQSKLWPAGTLCITIAANIADTAILSFDACFPDSIVGFHPGNELTTEFIHMWFVLYKQVLKDSAPESAQKNINLEILSKLVVMLPPKKLQQKFSAIFSSLEDRKRQMTNSLFDSEMLFSSVSQRAFGGEL
jgi:type I restriction enzyme S subunit